MSDAVLIFTFGPVQGFIEEARRFVDLYAGSRILVELAEAAANAIQDQGGQLVYPAARTSTGTPAKDTPNKLVAQVPWDQAEEIAQAAEKALQVRWHQHVGQARRNFDQQVRLGDGPAIDAAWDRIWQRQIAHHWEVYWAAAEIASPPGQDGYAEAYRQASRALDAAKRTRVFTPIEEPGRKDSLSGRREALHRQGERAETYWQAVSRVVPPNRLRAEGRERLDALGIIKRFGDFTSAAHSAPSFYSTSRVAAEDFIERLRQRESELGGAIHAYQSALRDLLGKKLYEVTRDPVWPYDGDLLYRETLMPERLQDSYHLLKPDLAQLDEARARLDALHRQAGDTPSPYYGIIVLDGDNMGGRIAAALNTPAPQAAHQALSERLSAFADKVPALVNNHHGQLIYNGGDDVLALAPLVHVLPLAQTLAHTFQAMTRGEPGALGATASAGVAIVHHHYPLSAALRAAREAERLAKAVPGKAALAVRVLRRSGETIDLRVRWETLAKKPQSILEQMIEAFQNERLAGRFAYEVLGSAYAFAKPDAAWEAELRRQLRRHWTARAAVPSDRDERDQQQRGWAEQLREWSAALPEPDPTTALGRWLVFARFVARGGGEG